MESISGPTRCIRSGHTSQKPYCKRHCTPTYYTRASPCQLYDCVCFAVSALRLCVFLTLDRSFLSSHLHPARPVSVPIHYPREKRCGHKTTRQIHQGHRKYPIAGTAVTSTVIRLAGRTDKPTGKRTARVFEKTCHHTLEPNVFGQNRLWGVQPQHYSCLPCVLAALAVHRVMVLSWFHVSYSSHCCWGNCTAIEGRTKRKGVLSVQSPASISISPQGIPLATSHQYIS